jgi:putative colanic acid biosynthesis acetyltransferase WcaF
MGGCSAEEPARASSTVGSVVERMQPLTPQTLSVRNKLGRILWNSVWLFLFRPSPRILHPWRCWLLKMFGAKIGSAVHPYPSARIWAPWNLEMDDGSSLGDYVDCYSVDKICIGKFTTVSQYTFLCTGSHDHTDLGMPLVSAPITIGERAWITSDVFVGPGVEIGDGAVVTARSSVFQDIPSWTIARGNPAVPIRERTLHKTTTAHQRGWVEK